MFDEKFANVGMSFPISDKRETVGKDRVVSALPLRNVIDQWVGRRKNVRPVIESFGRRTSGFHAFVGA
jgi:hypothetical protein